MQLQQIYTNLIIPRGKSKYRYAAATGFSYGSQRPVAAGFWQKRPFFASRQDRAARPSLLSRSKCRGQSVASEGEEETVGYSRCSASTWAKSLTWTGEKRPKVLRQRGQAVTICSGLLAVRLSRAPRVMGSRSS